MKKSLLLLAFPLLLSACIFDKEKDDGTTTLTLKGRVSELQPQVNDTVGGTVYYHWQLTIDSTTRAKLPEGEGICTYTGYLGDSVKTDYTNSMMYQEVALVVFRTGTVNLYAASTDPQFTHYRVVITCKQD